jgi:HJR/Mrr/RecB family endonuclease
MMECKGCRRTLVISGWTSRCMFCGRRAGAFRAALGTTKYTRRGQRRAVARTLLDEATASAAMTWQQAELLALDWMVRNGYRDAALTRGGADGGVDITSRRAIAQVKHHAKPVGLGELQRMSGIAVSMKRPALFFSSAGYTPKATEWARRHGVELYQFPPVRRIR